MTPRRTTDKRRVHYTLLLACLLLLLGACGAFSTEPASEGNDELHVVVTTSILGDVVAELVADSGTVETLMPVGADPHGFQLSARQGRSLREADLVISNGLGLEEGMTDALEAAEEEGANIFHVAEHVDPLEMGEGHGHDHENEAEDGHDHGEGLDPHFWLDPVRMSIAVDVIANELALLDVGPDDSEWQERAGLFADEIESAHEVFVGSLASIPPDDRVLITNHDALGYFADRYDFEIVDVVIPGGSSLGEASAGDIARLVDVITTEGVSAVVTENTDTSTLADTVAEESGTDVEVIRLAIGSLGAPGSSTDTYLGMMRSNVDALASALGSEG